MNAFDYFSPTTLREASELLAHYEGEAQVLAGGTDLLLKMKAGRLAPRALINVKRIPELRARVLGSRLDIGALTTLEELRCSRIVQKHFPALAAACSTMASVQIRNLATVGGNLCNAAPSADLAPILMALNSVARIAGPDGDRQVALEDFFIGPGQTVLAADELLVAVEVPPLAGPATYLKLSPRQRMDIAVVGVGLALQGYSPYSQQAESVRVVLGAVAPVPVRAKLAEAELMTGPLSPDRIERAARLAVQASTPIDDVRGSAWYRRRMVESITRRGLLELTGH